MVKSSFLEPKSGQKGQKWPPCNQITLANWIIHMNLHFRRSKIFGCDGHWATILSVSQLLSVKLRTWKSFTKPFVVIHIHQNNFQLTISLLKLNLILLFHFKVRWTFITKLPPADNNMFLTVFALGCFFEVGYFFPSK